MINRFKNGFIRLSRNEVLDTYKKHLVQDVRGERLGSKAAELLSNPAAGAAVLGARKAVIAAPLPPRPAFLLSKEATQKFIDSVRARMQNDPFSSVPDWDVIDAATLTANDHLDIAADVEFSLASAVANADYINQAWINIAHDAITPLLGDAADALPPFLDDIVKMPDFQIMLALISSQNLPPKQATFLFASTLTIAMGESQFTPRLKGKLKGSASGMWQLVDIARVEATRRVSDYLTSDQIELARIQFFNLAPSADDQRFQDIVDAFSLFRAHLDSIAREWKWTGDKWAALTTRAEKSESRYSTLLNKELPGFCWLMLLYHANDAPLPIPQYERDRVAKDYVLATVLDEHLSGIANFVASYRLNPWVNDLSKPTVARAVARSFSSNRALVAAADRRARAAAFLPKGTSLYYIGTKTPIPFSDFQKMRVYTNAKMGITYARPHKGLDLRAVNQPLFAVGDGIVRTISNDPKGYGNWLELSVPSNAASYRYAHMKKVLVKVGETVSKGDLIGISGSTGNAEGPHLHFEYYPFSSRVATDPKKDPYEAWKLTYNQA